MDLLARIKHLVWTGHVRYTQKAYVEMDRDDLEEEDVEAAIISARTVRSKRSTSPRRKRRGEKVHIIEGITLDGVSVYTKGVVRTFAGKAVFYVLVSAKRSRMEGDE